MCCTAKEQASWCVVMHVVEESGALLQALIELAQSQRYPAMSLSVDRNNQARHLYERLGFHDAGISDQGDTSVTMIKQWSKLA